jgi:acyl-coenzyme A thioesterase 9
MYDSYSELVLPFASNTQLFEEYTNASGGLRTGKLMEHLDSLAGSIAYKHLLGPAVQNLGTIQQRGFYIVTASVDRFVLQIIKLFEVMNETEIQVRHVGSTKSSA